MTSHASVNLMLALEDEFDIEFPDRLLKRSVFKSVAAIRDLFAITALPEQQPEQQTVHADHWVVFINTSGARRIGPNRMWTRFARRLAAQGIPSIHFDVTGSGDSAARSARHSRPCTTRRSCWTRATCSRTFGRPTAQRPLSQSVFARARTPASTRPRSSLLSLA